ncbi:MAG: serine/threonine-protein kinase [Nanoarchaeota archaeon]
MSVEVAKPKSEYLINRIARVDKEIKRGGFGVVYEGQLENLFALVAERYLLGDSNLAPLLGLEAPEKHTDTQTFRPVTDEETRYKAFCAANEQWNEYRRLRDQNPEAAHNKFQNILSYIDPALSSKRIAIKAHEPLGFDKVDPKDLDKRLVEMCKNQFLREVRILSSLKHPNIVQYFGFVPDPNYGLCLLMEYLEGHTLAVTSATGKPMPAPTALEIILDVAETLQYCHDDPSHPPIWHRDLKPSNIIMVEKENKLRPTLIDFGLGKFADAEQTQMTIAGSAMGTPRYMAPEQWAGDPAKLGPWTDVYALGAIFYELLAAQPAYAEGDETTLRTTVTNLAIPHPKTLREFPHLENISDDMNILLEGMRRKDVSKRLLIPNILELGRKIQAEEKYLETRKSVTLSGLLLEEKIQDLKLELTQTQIRYLRIKEGIDQARTLIKQRKYPPASSRLEELAKTALTLSKKHDPQKKDILKNITKLAYLQYRAGAFLDVETSLSTAKLILDKFPAVENAIEHARYMQVDKRFAKHRGAVKVLKSIQESYIAEIREALTKQPDSAKCKELQGRLDEAKNFLIMVDIEKVGKTNHAKTQKDVDELDGLLQMLSNAPVL